MYKKLKDYLKNCLKNSLEFDVKKINEITKTHGTSYKDYFFEVRNNSNEEIFLLATRCGFTDIVEKLLEKNRHLNINIQNIVEQSALVIAIEMDYPDIAKTLIEHNIDVNIKCNFGAGALTWLAGYSQKLSSNWIKIAKLIIKNGADINLEDYNAETPLISTCFSGQLELASILIKHGAEMSGIYYSPIVVASKCKHIKIVELLTDKGIHIDTQDKNGQTGLMEASENGDLKIVNFFLDNINIQNKSGKTALNIARNNKRTEIISRLMIDKQLSQAETYEFSI